MDLRNKRKIKDGLQMGLAWLVWSVISEWHELRTPLLAKNALVGVIGGSVLFGLIFGLSFRPLFGFVARHYVRGNKTKSGVEGTRDHLNAGDPNPR
jgi:hypothetical protein